MHGSDLMLSYQSWIIVTIEAGQGPHPFTQSGKLVNPETKYFTDRGHRSGKTFLACALGHNACRQGYKVYYYRLKALMEQCYQGHADGRYSKLLTRLNNSDLLLLDDWGLEPLSSEQRSDLLEIVDLMYQRGSIIVVSQLPVENWYKMIGDSTHADAILDRLVHGSIKIELKGESMRKIQSPLTEGDQ